MLGVVRQRLGCRTAAFPFLPLAFKRVGPAASVAGKNYSTTVKEWTKCDALNSALYEEMVADPKVFIMGEEVGEYQEAYKVSGGLLDKYGPDRVRDTPIIEDGGNWSWRSILWFVTSGGVYDL